MPIVKMLRSKMGSNDGVTTKMYEEGKEYEVSEDLAASFVAEKLAETTDGSEPKPTASKLPPEAKAQPVKGKPARAPYVDGDVYTDKDGKLFVGAVMDGEVALLPIDQLTEAERADLVKAQKLTADGKAVQLKSIEAAPQNRALPGAPQNKAK